MARMADTIAWDTCSKKQKPCVGWVKKYFGDCVCDRSSGLSFSLGLLSLVGWGVAEIPQIVTNFRSKSSHGVSLALLLTWVLGDILNLVGCLLEPVTLPTQFYTALLYTATTVVLVMQVVYYDYLLGWKRRRVFATRKQGDEEEKTLDPKQEEASKPLLTTNPSNTSDAVDVFYVSARSLARSSTPSYGSSYLRSGRNRPSEHTFRQDHDGEDPNDSSSEGEIPEPEERSSPSTYNQFVNRIKQNLPRSVCYGTFLSGSATLPSRCSALMGLHVDLMQEKGIRISESNRYGLVLGWIMAAIYMGGRLPQIYLNIKRGTVEGLNPLMFIFALIANATYVGSIVTRSVEWERIKANAPWLLDAVVCVLLDLFILIQFGYYKLAMRRTPSAEDSADKKPLLM